MVREPPRSPKEGDPGDSLVITKAGHSHGEFGEVSDWRGWRIGGVGRRSRVSVSAFAVRMSFMESKTTIR
jgi:hypothetical protein